MEPFYSSAPSLSSSNPPQRFLKMENMLGTLFMILSVGSTSAQSMETEKGSGLYSDPATATSYC